MTPQDWNTALAVHVPRQIAYGVIEREARALLGQRANDAPLLSTAELGERLYPATAARGDGILARKRLFRGLLAISDKAPGAPGLSDCATLGEARASKNARFGATMVRPRLWHAPRASLVPNVTQAVASGLAVICPHCGKEIW